MAQAKTCNETLYVLDYLNNFGYLNVQDNAIKHVDTANLSNALLLFQEYYGLKTTGQINNATLKLINTPRCGVKDDIYSFSTTSYKWNKKLIKWHYALVNNEILKVTQAAFDVWSKHADIKFEHNNINPDITISNKRKIHKFQRSSNICIYKFDGIGGVLGHAYYPDETNSPIEIHIDADEKWYLKMDNQAPKNMTNLFVTLIHEIGHSLGLGHSNDPNSVMYAFYNTDDIKLELQTDDIYGIQSLYDPAKPVIPTISTTSRAIIPTKGIPKLCDLTINQYLIVNQFMYIFYKEWFWIIDIGNANTQSEVPQLITNWLTFLPAGFKEISGIYQKPSGEIVIFVDNQFYMINFPSLNLISGYPKYISELGISRGNTINGVVNTYTGRTFLFYNDNYYLEINDCFMTPKYYGLISKSFPGVPQGINSAFRYTNGNLYFFKDGLYYEFSEFNNTIIRAGRNTLSLFGIKCTTSYINIIEQIKKLVINLGNLVS